LGKKKTKTKQNKNKNTIKQQITATAKHFTKQILIVEMQCVKNIYIGCFGTKRVGKGELNVLKCPDTRWCGGLEQSPLCRRPCLEHASGLPWDLAGPCVFFARV